MGHFVLDKITPLPTSKVKETILHESDYAVVADGSLYQFTYVEEEVRQYYKVKPGIWNIEKTMSGLELMPSSFTQDSILTEYVHTKDLTDQMDKFFSKVDTLKEYGVEVPRRNILLWGPPGQGKSTAIGKASTEYAKKGNTAIIIWSTDKFDAVELTPFFKSFDYSEVSQLIIVAEDLGGVEIDQARFRSDSSLLSLLDNNEKVFTVPTMIIATTNFPENFLANITNRPGRFDVKLKMREPSPEFRIKFLEFFYKKEIAQEVKDKLATKECDKMSVAHIKEVVLRSIINDITILESLNEVLSDIKTAEKAFNDKAKKIGMSWEED